MNQKRFGRELSVFLTELYHSLHARSCMHFLWFTHARWFPRRLQRPQNQDVLLGIAPQIVFVGGEAVGPMVPWCRSGAMLVGARASAS